MCRSGKEQSPINIETSKVELIPSDLATAIDY